MRRSKGVSTRQINAIRSLSRKGYSANRIQRKLRSRHIGMRRTKLLGYVREFKRRPPPKQPYRYVPHKYRKPSMIPIIITTKHIKLTGTHRHKRTSKTKTGSGPELYRFVKHEMDSDYWDGKPTIKS